jgi:hypothetical protein
MERLNLVILAMVMGICFVVYLILYRLHYHPLVQFPGPVLARATYAYEWYYDLVLGGQYTFKLRELHAKYGPVVRLNPDELHFDDPNYYDEIFNVTNGEAEKPYRVANVFGPYPAVLGFAFSKLHPLGLRLTIKSGDRDARTSSPSNSPWCSESIFLETFRLGPCAIYRKSY